MFETGRDYSIIMLDGTPLKRHFSDIVCASATKSESEFTLIDHFQLIDWKDKTPSDHLYPKFKLLLENFKRGEFIDTPTITQEHSKDITNQENSAPYTITGDQRLLEVIDTKSPTGIDVLLNARTATEE